MDPVVEVFPGSTSKRQETLLISPDQTAHGFVISHAKTGNHFLTAASPSLSYPGPSHTKYFYGTLKSSRIKLDRKDSSSSNGERESTKICALQRDAMSFRKCHHVYDPYNDKRLLEMEFSTSSWNSAELKATIVLLNKYSEIQPMEPVKLKWRGRKMTLEGVLEWNNKPVAVCASGAEMNEGEYLLYIAPGMDMYVCSIVVMAVDDRARRASDDKDMFGGLNRRRSSVQVA